MYIVHERKNALIYIFYFRHYMFFCILYIYISESVYIEADPALVHHIATSVCYQPALNKTTWYDLGIAFYYTPSKNCFKLTK